MENLKEQYTPLLQLYKKAEDTIHILGLESDGLDTAAINELRYAGQHTLLSIMAEDSAEREKQLSRARAHCERAIYDAFDSAIYFRLTQFQEFVETYKTVVISDIVPNYADLSREMKEAKELLFRTRAESENREKYYAQIEKQYQSLAIASDTLEASRDELNKTLKRESSGSFRFWIQIGVTIIAAFAGTMSYFVLANLFFNSP